MTTETFAIYDKELNQYYYAPTATWYEEARFASLFKSRGFAERERELMIQSCGACGDFDSIVIVSVTISVKF